MEKIGALLNSLLLVEKLKEKKIIGIIMIF